MTEMQLDTHVNALSSNYSLYHNASHRVRIIIHTEDMLFTPDCAISHYLLYLFFILAVYT